MKERLKNMPIPVVATMLGAATLSNIYQGLGYDWIRHLTMWAATAVLLCYMGKIILTLPLQRGNIRIRSRPASMRESPW